MTETLGTWPVARLGRISHLKVLGAGLPGTVVHERVIDAPFDVVWPWIADLERSVPIFDDTVGSVEIVRREGNRLRVRTRLAGPLPFRARFDVDLDEGWCLMVSRPGFYVVGLAAEPDGDRTRWAHLEGIAVATRWPSVQRVLKPFLKLACWRHHRHVAHDIEGIIRAVSGPR